MSARLPSPRYVSGGRALGRASIPFADRPLATNWACGRGVRAPRSMRAMPQRLSVGQRQIVARAHFAVGFGRDPHCRMQDSKVIIASTDEVPRSSVADIALGDLFTSIPELTEALGLYLAGGTVLVVSVARQSPRIRPGLL